MSSKSKRKFKFDYIDPKKLIYKRTYWVFKNCGRGSRMYLKQLKQLYRATVPKDQHKQIFTTLTTEFLDSEFSPGKKK